MYCKRCGNELKKSDRFCGNCGSEVFFADKQKNIDKHSGQAGKKNWYRVVIGIIIICFSLAAVCLVTGIYLKKRTAYKTVGEVVQDRKSEETKVSEDKKNAETPSGKGDTEPLEEKENDEDLEDGKNNGETEVIEKKSPMLNQSLTEETLRFSEKIKTMNDSSFQFPEIKIYAQNYSPAPRDTTYIWDSALFYSLEDISLNSYEDGKLNTYVIERKRLKNTETENVIEPELFTEQQHQQLKSS